MLVIYGLPLGLLAAGSLIDEIGFAATGTLYAMAGVALMMAIVLHWRADPVACPRAVRIAKVSSRRVGYDRIHAQTRSFILPIAVEG